MQLRFSVSGGASEWGGVVGKRGWRAGQRREVSDGKPGRSEAGADICMYVPQTDEEKKQTDDDDEEEHPTAPGIPC